MKKISEKVIAGVLAAACVIGCSAYVSASGFGGTLPATGYDTWGTSKKRSSSTTFTLNVKRFGNNNNYRFWGYKDGNGPKNRETTESSASGTGYKYAYYASSSQAKALVGSYIGLTAKTGPTVFTPMWFEGEFTP